MLYKQAHMASEKSKLQASTKPNAVMVMHVSKAEAAEFLEPHPITICHDPPASWVAAATLSCTTSCTNGILQSAYTLYAVTPGNIHKRI